MVFHNETRYDKDEVKGELKVANVLNVAGYIIKEMGPMTTMKLQKLTYYCQAWSLAWDGESLFDEEFQAWANGPVCPELFAEHKGIFKVEANFLEGYSTYEFSEDQLETIHAVIDYYGDKTPSYLSELTHKERPWRETRGSTSAGDSCEVDIPKDLLQDYYGGLQ